MIRTTPPSAIPRLTPRSFDPGYPMRDPRSKKSVALAAQDMAGVIMILASASFDGTVSEDDLHKAGFTNGEIGQCRETALALFAAMRKPRAAAEAA